tara:strand:- start:378 stop:734 length:357 start_codon:yes stop_codon:yes gene_type:complete
MKLLIENWRQYLIEQVASPLTVEFDGHQNEYDQTTYFFKVNGHEIEILVTQLYDPEQVAEYLAIEIEDDERFPGVDSDNEAQIAAITKQIDTPEFHVATKEARAEVDEYAEAELGGVY